MATEALRPICWRMLLGVISGTDRGQWSMQLKSQVGTYLKMKNDFLPTIDKVSVDPLSALSSGDSQSEEWSAFYKNVDLTNFIKGDLDRLFLSGIEEEFFQSKHRRNSLLNILFIWSTLNPSISYRQGMHEIAGCILHCIEVEKREWEKAISKKEIPENFSLYDAFSDTTIEPHTYFIFERIMRELGTLYDPASNKSRGNEGQPFVVQYCSKIQEHYLRILDPELCSHLEDSFVQSQLYGLRWSRLMLGREFQVNDAQLFRLWDFIFACCYDAENFPLEEANYDEDMPPNVYSILANARFAKHTMRSNQSEEMAAQHRQYYVCTPLLGALGDFMLAMIINIRTTLMESDSAVVMSHLMHYPEVDNVAVIIDYADMIRRGVFIQDAHLGGAERPVLNSYNNSAQQGDIYTYNPAPKEHGSVPNWLMKGSRPFNGMGKKLNEGLSAVRSAVGSGINELVNTIVPLTDEPEPSTSTKTPPLAKVDRIAEDRAVAKKRSSKTEQAGKDHHNHKGKHKDKEQHREGEGEAVHPPQPLGDFDPLMGGAVNTSSKKTSPRITPVTGDSEENSEQAPSQPLDPLLAAASTAATRKHRHKSKEGVDGGEMGTPQRGGSIFGSSAWFPSSSSKQEKKRDKRISGGVDLGLLQSAMPEESATKKSSSLFASKHTPSSAGKSSQLANNNAVSDRLLEIAESLEQISFAAMKEDAGFERKEADFRKQTVRKIKALADVLAGMTSIVEYDTKFANAQRTETPPPTALVEDQETVVTKEREVEGKQAVTSRPDIIVPMMENHFDGDLRDEEPV